MIIKNNTHYFGEYTKIYNAFPDPDSFSFESSKRMGYFQRLFFEFSYTRKVLGIVFYYTCTYNDFHIPKFYGKNCFSYQDIRYITNGRLSKILDRKYGSRLKYFCACESGEGAGTRGLGNNPHYHFIFFVQPKHDKLGNPIYEGYRCITPQEFKDIMYELWQGRPSNVYVDWRFAKYGHVQEGHNNGEVLSCDAFSYVGKYCVKDLNEKQYEDSLRTFFYNECIEHDIDNVVLYEYYKFLRATDSSCTDKYKFFEYMHLHEFARWRKETGYVDKRLERFLFDYCGVHGQIVIKQLLDYWHDGFIPAYIECRLSEYRNLYSGKCRMSKSLGEYGLKFIVYQDGSPRVVLNTSKGYEVQYPCLYYIRKLFYDVKICPITGNPLYYLNDTGVKLKLQQLPSTLDDYVCKLNENINYCYDNNVPLGKSDSDLQFNDILDHSVPKVLPSDWYETDFKSPEYSYDKLLIELSTHKDRIDILYRYAVYHYVYQYRNYNTLLDIQLDERCRECDVLNDYSLFLKYNSYFLDYESGCIYDMVFKQTLKSFRNHPAFKPYVKYFDFLDNLMTVVGQLRSDNKKHQFKSKSEYQKRMSSFKFNSYGVNEQIVLSD